MSRSPEDALLDLQTEAKAAQSALLFEELSDTDRTRVEARLRSALDAAAELRRQIQVAKAEEQAPDLDQLGLGNVSVTDLIGGES
jgi:hypothetical protein